MSTCTRTAVVSILPFVHQRCTYRRCTNHPTCSSMRRVLIATRKENGHVRMPAVMLSCMPTPRASGVACTLNAVVSSLPLVHQRYEYRWCTNTPAYGAPTALPLPVVHMPLPVVHMPQYYKLTCPRALCRFSSKQTSQHVPNSSPCCSPNK